MNFEADGDLAAFLTFVERLAARHQGDWSPTPARFDHSQALERELVESGFFNAASEPSLGLLAATAMVFELSKLPVCAEVAASSLIAPLLCPDLPRPFAVLWQDHTRPARFLPMARTALAVRGDAVMAAPLRDGDVAADESLFAYPMGRLRAADALPWQVLSDVLASRLCELWRLGIAAEITGSLLAALDAVVAHVTQRRQFGRPLGSFQALQHRLAACTSLIEGTRWLLFKAASTGAAVDIVTAVASAQSMATKVVYDLHQFMGAMGLTLEHPLHRWTYRARLLRSELGGAERHFEALADLAWPATPSR